MRKMIPGKIYTFMRKYFAKCPTLEKKRAYSFVQFCTDYISKHPHFLANANPLAALRSAV
jgi:hypothetical protein